MDQNNNAVQKQEASEEANADAGTTQAQDANAAAGTTQAQHWPPWWPNCGPFPCPPHPRPHDQNGAAVAKSAEGAAQDQTWPPWLPNCGPFPCPPRPHDQTGAAAGAAQDQTWPPWLPNCGPFPCPPRPHDQTGAAGGAAQDQTWPEQIPCPRQQIGENSTGKDPEYLEYSKCSQKPVDGYSANDPALKGMQRSAKPANQNAPNDCFYGVCPGDPDPTVWNRSAGGAAVANAAGGAAQDQTWPPWLSNCGPFPCPPTRPHDQTGAAGGTAQDQTSNFFPWPPPRPRPPMVSNGAAADCDYLKPQAGNQHPNFRQQ